MKFKTIFSVGLCIGIGILLSNFMFNQYDTLAVSNTNKVYFLQIGSYASKTEMEKNMMDVQNYIVEQKDDTYYTYIGLTMDKNNYIKLKDYYEKKGYNIEKKEKIISNNEFVEKLKKYDLLLKETTDSDTLKIIINQIMNYYKETIISD